ncbi:hypothetical protein C0991_005285 [Blastosporella zonata]|nr:hypothetical protein C0991_005285 [Blastosporella zonata]
MSSSRRQPSRDGYSEIELSSGPYVGQNTNSTTHLKETTAYPTAPQNIESHQFSNSTSPLSSSPRVAFASPQDAERGPAAPGLPYHSKSRNSSWDLLGGIKRLEHSYEQFDMRNASQAHLVYADGDVPKTKDGGPHLPSRE